MELDERIKRLFQTRINRHKRKAKDSMPGWGLGDSCFADELEEVRDGVLAIIALELLKTKVVHGRR